MKESVLSRADSPLFFGFRLEFGLRKCYINRLHLNINLFGKTRD